jgi:hypothetical protein
MGLIAQLRWIGDGPKNHERLDDGSNGCVLGHHQQSRARLPDSQSVTEVIEHRPAVMGYQYPVGHCCPFQELGIFDAS